MTPWPFYGMLTLLHDPHALTPRSHLVPFMLRQITPTAKLSDELTLDALATAVPHATIQAVVADLGVREQRRRDLPADVTLVLGIAMNLFTHEALADVYHKLVAGLRFIWPEPELSPVSKSAITQARYRLGARPMVELFHRVCRPLATSATPGAFRFGLRLMAIDGTTEVLADTPANAQIFGRPSNQQGAAALPQTQAVYLIECGTHAIVDAGFWPYATSERVGGRRLLRSVTSGMLLLWDRGFHGYEMAQQTRQRQAHFLGRVPDNVVLTPVKLLPDGSYLADLRPADRGPRPPQPCPPLRVRVLAYTLDDPSHPGHGERHRLMTSLLDPLQAPALDLVMTYHDRWEEELVIDELDTHQRLVDQPLRSRKPVGVIQELYGLLIAHYAIRTLMQAAAAEAGVAPTRLSFLHAVRLIVAAIPEFQMVAPAQRPALYQRLLHDIGRGRLAQRQRRSNPRVVRRKLSKFPVRRPEHRPGRQSAKAFRDTIVLLN